MTQTQKGKARNTNRIQRRPVHGVLLLDKPVGLSSNDALQKVKWLLRAEKAGHTGTLDPLATGLLPLCFGAATKFSQLHLDANKYYQTTLQLGTKTTTGDAEGDILQILPVSVTDEQLDKALLQWTGAITQLPPMYSALKKDGKPLYEYARAGMNIERAARHVQIFSLKGQMLPEHNQAMLEVACSKGTYIRTLGEDIGHTLGCGAHLQSLRRTRTGGFDIAQTVTLTQLESMTETERMGYLLPTQILLAEHATLKVVLDANDTTKFLTGMRRRGTWQDTEMVSVFGCFAQQAVFIGSASVLNGELIPTRLLSPTDLTQLTQIRTKTSEQSESFIHATS